MKKFLHIKTNAFQLVISGLSIIGMLALLLCIQSAQVHYCTESNNNDTVFFSGGLKNDIAALCGNTRRTQFFRTDNFSATSNSAEAATNTPLLCFKVISNIHNKANIPTEINHNCDFIVHTAPTRASPFLFIA